jgi:4-hydroxy-4-methyl-2-oxoglutarate aldolase
MAHFVVREIDRADPAVMAALRHAGVATVHEAAGRTGLLGPGIRPVQDGTRIAGPAVTVSCPPGDNLMVHAAVEMVAPGDVLVVTTTSRSTDGMVGELIATSLAHRGCAGLVIDAGVPTSPTCGRWASQCGAARCTRRARSRHRPAR